MEGEIKTNRCLPLVQAVPCSQSFRQDGMGCKLQSSSTSFLSAVTPLVGVDLLLVDARLERGRGAGILLPRGVARGVQDGESFARAGCPPHLREEAQWSGGQHELYQSHSGERQEQIHAVVSGREQQSPAPAG